MSGIGLPGRVKPRKPHPVTPYAAQRIRFGILAAREIVERRRLTEDQQDYIEGCELAGWKVGDTRKAFDREWDAAQARNYTRRQHA